MTVRGDETIENGTPVRHDTRWWQSVRLRFGLLLALALLPWLLLSALETYAELDRARVSQSRLADIVASSTVAEVGQTLEAGRLGLDAAPQIIADLGCEAGSSEVLDRLGVYTALIVKDATNTVICQNPSSVSDLVLENPDAFSADKLFRIEAGLLGSGDQAEMVVVLQTVIRSSGHTYTLILPENLGRRDVLDVTLGAGYRITLTKLDGTGIVGMDRSEERNQFFLDRIADADVSLLDYTNRFGEDRRSAARYFKYLGIYVFVGRPIRLENILSLINPYTSVMLPILAWLVGFGLIWIGTRSMLLAPISKVRRTARLFAGGKMDSRVRLSDSAAAEVQGLANSFNSMAHQLQERDLRIADNMDEKDTLMREIHHRVKNNLQIIISLLNMQERKAVGAEAVEAISETRTRINAIAIVHRGLYESTDLRGIDVAPFISRLVASISESIGAEEAGISVKQSVAPCHLSADHAIPVALFIVEAISNAAEHGVERGGTIHIDIQCPETGILQIDVADDGRGVGDPDAMRGIGTRLMKGFARQLAGTLVFQDNAPGLTARLTLPIDDSPEQPFQVSQKRR